MTPAEKRSWADDVIRQMGLATVAGTRIGGRVCKGISGGQRKRVSICIELLASPALIFLDEPTSGLDSATSYHVMSRIAGIARRNGTTVVAAIHQPSTEVFELFHGLCLLANGRAVYFGPASKAIEFFDANGFPCPLRRNPSDHFLRMINTDFEGDHVLQQRQASFWTKSIVLTKRSMINMHRDIGYYWLRFVINIALFLTIGTIFFNVGHNYASIQIFEKEQRSGHYGAIEFRGIEHFFFFVATLWTCTMLVEGLMMIVAAIVPDFLLGIITGSRVQGLLMLNAGFFRLPNDLPKPIWKYPTYYISYQKYTTQGLSKNEFLGLVFQDLGLARGIDISGKYILKYNLQVELGYSKWVVLAILLGMVIIYRVLFLVIIKVSKMAKPFIKCLIAKV
uniref:ABC transporter domain-containing protein n=1 Tax=Aegilops tauschii subsp. strangulata TaxID=200361 RepID=A0A453AQ11_AEGTS